MLPAPAGKPFPAEDRECFDHIFSHSAAWNIWRQCVQRVTESKWSGAETAQNKWKLCKKSFLTSLSTVAQI